ncbi:MAG: hypothetical protein NZ703_01635 [Gemmataceae bacterium]|nr:hypothetical protein [Gemmataceae bacterium]
MLGRWLFITMGSVWFLASSAVGGEPTFTKDVAPILYNHCTSCHRPNEVGPFNLITYADAKRRGRQLVEVTTRRVMPPWKPVKGHGQFLYDRSLSEEQIAIIQKWYEAGMPEGDAKDLPPLPKFTDGWHLGPPDLILKVEKPFRIPAEGDDLYVHFVLPTGLTKDQPFRAVQVLPSNKRVAHHAVPMLDVHKGKAYELARKDGYYIRFDPGFLPRGFLPGYAPGMMTHELPEDQPGVLPQGMDVVLQMHYHPTGKEEWDQPQIGIYFADKPPKRNPSVILLANNEIDIPPGERHYKRTDQFQLPVDYEIRSIFAHMHMIGKQVRVWAELPDKTKRSLLYIDDWDYRWQDTYVYAKPPVLPRGTIIKAEFIWDNSESHPRNPYSPPRRIRWGERSTDEMSGIIIGGMTVKPNDEGWHWLAVLGHYFDIERKANAAKSKWKAN